MNIYTFLTFATSASCLLVGNFIYYRNKNSKLHIIFALGYYLGGAYCFSLAGFHLSRTGEEAWMWLRITAMAHFIAPISFHGIWLLTKGHNASLKNSEVALVYIPFISIFFQDIFFPELTYDVVQPVNQGWAVTLKTTSIFHLLDMSVYGIVLAIEFFLLIRILVTSINKLKRKLALFLLINVLVPISLTALLLFVFPFFQNPVFRVEALFVLFVVITTAVGLYKFNIFDLTTEILSRDIIANMSTFYILVDKDCNILEVNGKTTALFGYTTNELIGAPLLHLFEQEKYESVFSQSSQKKSYTIESYCRSKEDRSIPVILSITPVLMKNEFLGFIIIGNDLSDVKKIKIEKEIAELELRALVSQMNPHFIFNSLNTIQHFVTLNDERAANLYLSKFAGLMRRILDNSTQPRVKLEEEIECLRLYLDLEALRLKDKFNYTLSIDEQVNALEELIPPMIIQPVLENAIWHGIHPKQGAGLLQINFTKADDRILCKIEDNGIGRKRSKELKQFSKLKHQSRAIKNIERRIDLLNGQADAHAIKMEIIDKKENHNEEAGTIVKIHFPITIKNIN